MSQHRSIIFGPTKAGKTLFLASLQHAADNRERGEQGRNYRIQPHNPDATTLFANARELIAGNAAAINATRSLQRFEFGFRIDQGLDPLMRAWVSLRDFTRTVRGLAVDQGLEISMRDGPGGWLFDDSAVSVDGELDYQAEMVGRQELLDDLRAADSAILCIDATAPDRAMTFFRSLPSITGRLGSSTLPFKRLAICLTKADAHFQSERHSARRAMERQDPVARARTILTRPGVNALFNYLEIDAEVVVGWTSAFGFTANGEANFDPGTQSLLMHAGLVDAREAIEGWRPCNVLDPFVFLATGDPGNFRRWRP